MVAKLYSPELAGEICRRISEGETLIKICADKGIDRHSVWVWIRQYPEFKEQYDQARRDQADVFADEVNEIADSAKDLKDAAAVGAARLRVDARKWAAQKMAPDKYGDRLDVRQEVHVTAQHLHAVMELSLDEPVLSAIGRDGHITRVGPAPVARALEYQADEIEAVNPFED